MKINPHRIKGSLLLGALLIFNFSQAQTDTLRVMAYNVLYYGDTPPCQGSHSAAHGYLSTIVSYSNPDIIGLDKMAAIPMFTGDHSGSAPAGFADSILQFSLNIAYPGRYAYCTYSNDAGADNIGILFYDQQKLGFINIISSYSNITDFNTYKLFYKSADLESTHDTIFLYITLNHTNSGSSSSDQSIRADQINGEMAGIQSLFTHLPNAINMGDFNTHKSSEVCYQTLVAPANPAFRYYDPPFSPDGDISYPADWDSNPSAFATYLTTSTRLSGMPNSCGSSGGGKSWYDHIFLSDAIAHNLNAISYIPHSYRTIGNDGNRVGKSINATPINTSAPGLVIDALYRMSNKYPVMVDLAVNPHTSDVKALAIEKVEVRIVNPVKDLLVLNFDNELIGKNISLQCINMLGQIMMSSTFSATNEAMRIPCTLRPGIYNLRISAGDKVVSNKVITKE